MKYFSTCVGARVSLDHGFQRGGWPRCDSTQSFTCLA